MGEDAVEIFQIVPNIVFGEVYDRSHCYQVAGMYLLVADARLLLAKLEMVARCT